MIKNSDNKKYEKFINSIHTESLIFEDITKSNLNHVFLSIEKIEATNPPVSYDDFREIMYIARTQPFIIWHLCNKCDGKFNEEQMSEIINECRTSKPDLLLHLLEYNNLTNRNIKHLLSALDDVLIYIEDVLGKKGEYNGINISTSVYNYLFKYRQSDFKDWDYSPVRYSSVCVQEYAQKELDKGNFDEKLMAAIASNELITTDLRNRAFDNGCNFEDVTNPTQHMSEEMYNYFVEGCKGDFLSSYDKVNDETIKKSFALLKHNIIHFPTSCITDLINRVECEGITVSSNMEILSLIAKNKNDAKILKQILKTKNNELINTIINRKSIDSETYATLIDLRPRVNENDIRKAFLTLLFSEHNPYHRFYDNFIKEKNMNMYKMILMSPYTPQYIINRLDEKADKEVKVLIKLRKTMQPALDIDISDAKNKWENFYPYQYFVASTITKGGPEYEYITNKMNFRNSPVTSEQFCKLLISSTEYEINSRNDIYLMRLMQHLKNFKEEYKHWEWKKENIPCFKEIDGRVLFDFEKVIKFDKHDYENCFERIGKINNSETLRYLFDRMSDAIEYTPTANQRNVYAIYKSTEIYNALLEKLSEIIKINLNTKLNQHLNEFFDENMHTTP